MTILIIIAIRVAIAYIFGKESAQNIIWGSGALGLTVIVLFLVGALLYYFWTQIQENESIQRIIVSLILVLGIFPMIREKWNSSKKKDGESKEGK